MARTPKPLQKRATNPQVNPNSGGIILVGIDPGYQTDAPTFSFVGAAGGNSVTATLSSGNASLFEYIMVQITDARGRGSAAKYAGAPLVINTTNVSKASSTTLPNITILVSYKLKEGISLKSETPELSYSIGMDAGSFQAGFTIDNAARLNTTDRGAQIEITAVYDASGTPDITTIDIVCVTAIGLIFNVQKDGVSVGNITVGADGTGQLVANGTLASGSYVFKAICTSAGATFGSYAETTVVVP